MRKLVFFANSVLNKYSFVEQTKFLKKGRFNTRIPQNDKIWNPYVQCTYLKNDDPLNISKRKCKMTWVQKYKQLKFQN